MPAAAQNKNQAGEGRRQAQARIHATPWHILPVDSVMKQVGAILEGLATAEATRRLQEYGPNALREAAAVHPLTILLGQFKSLVVWLLIGAGVISGLLGEWIDSIAIIAIVILNAVIGFYQEYSAERAIAALKKMTAPRAKVWRDWRVVVIPAVEGVPGDIIELEAGDLAPADARLLEAASLKSVEAAQTGESATVGKRAVTLDQADAPSV